jgi:hypothetical protein
LGTGSLGTIGIACSAKTLKCQKISTFPTCAKFRQFGTAAALCQSMMPCLIESAKQPLTPHITRAQAKELLEQLRAAYQSLSLSERGFIKAVVQQMGRAQLLQKVD